ncbi:hypothetical protein B4U79_14381, partial [Dinothrombium tinctorium]
MNRYKTEMNRYETIARDLQQCKCSMQNMSAKVENLFFGKESSELARSSYEFRAIGIFTSGCDSVKNVFIHKGYWSMINGGDRIKALNCLDVSVTIHKGGKMIG